MIPLPSIFSRASLVWLLLSCAIFSTTHAQGVSKDESVTVATDEPSTLGYESSRQPEFPPIPDAPSAEALNQSILRGITWAEKNQNQDGSWGSSGKTKALNIHAPGEASHRAYRLGTSSLMLMGLMALEDDYPQVSPLIDRGKNYLLTELPILRRYDQTVYYSVWGHAYGMQALLGLMARENDPKLKQQMSDLIKDQIVQLQRLEVIGGGWAYYGDEALSSRPNSKSNSFVAATVMIAFYQAKQAGFEIPTKMVERGIKFIKNDRNPDGTYLYSSDFLNSRANPINRPEGSLARSQACNLALYYWDKDQPINQQKLHDWVEKLVQQHGWLDLGRGRPIPHESFFAIAGYFYHYGMYYGCESAAELEPEAKKELGGHLSGYLVARQRKDGSWFDYPLYNYGYAYATGYALASLAFVLPEDWNPSELTGE